VEELSLGAEASTGARELEGPEEVVGLLELGSDRVDLVDEVINALDSLNVEAVLDHDVLADRDALLVDLSESALEDELLDGLEGRVAVGNIRLNEAEHTDGGVVKLDEGTVVELAEAEELHDLLGLGGDANDTADADDKAKLLLGRDKESTLSLGLAAGVDGGLLGGLVLSGVLGSAGSESLLVGTVGLLGGLGSDEGISGNLGLSLLLLEDGFGGLGHFYIYYCGREERKGAKEGGEGLARENTGSKFEGWDARSTVMGRIRIVRWLGMGCREYIRQY